MKKTENNSKNKAQSDPTLIFKKYRLLKHIGGGSFGTVFLGVNIKTNENVAIKIEERKLSKPTLEREAYILFSLKSPGLPDLKTFGRTKKYNILIEALLGKSLYDLYNDCDKKFTIKDICMLSIQILERIEIVHCKNYIHRDIKPHNILLGFNDSSLIYLIDFGLAKKYRSERGNHVKFSVTKQIVGTPRFCSINAMRGVEQSRRDDLESIMYLILYFIKGSLPWQGLKIDDKELRFKKITEIKKSSKLEDLCEGMPKEIFEFCQYIKKLEFEQNPDYEYMKNCFYNILKKNGMENDNIFSWLQENEKNLILNMPKHVKKTKTSPHKRLLNQIQASLEKKVKAKKEAESVEKNKNINNNNITSSTNNISNNNIKNNYTLIPVKDFDKEKEKNDITLNTVFLENNGGMDISGIDINHSREYSKNKNLSIPKNKLLSSSENMKGLSLNKLTTTSSLTPNKSLNLTNNNEKDILKNTLTKNSITVNDFRNIEYHYLPINNQNNELKLNDNSFLKTNDYIPSTNVEPNMLIDPALDKISKIEVLKSQISATKDIIFFDASNNVNALTNNQGLKLHNFIRQEEKKEDNGYRFSHDEVIKNNVNNNNDININMNNNKKLNSNNCKVNCVKSINMNNNDMKRINNNVIINNTIRNHNNSNIQNLRKIDINALENSEKKNNIGTNKCTNNRQNVMNMNKNYRKINNINNNIGIQTNNYNAKMRTLNNKSYIENKNNNVINNRTVNVNQNNNQNIPLNIAINNNNSFNYKSPLLNNNNMVNQNRINLNNKPKKFISNNEMIEVNNKRNYFSELSVNSPNIMNNFSKSTAYSYRTNNKPCDNNRNNVNKNILNYNKNVNQHNINNGNNFGMNKIIKQNNNNYQVMNTQNNLDKKNINELSYNTEYNNNTYMGSNHTFPRNPQFYNQINNNININVSQSIPNNFLMGDQNINFINHLGNK